MVMPLLTPAFSSAARSDGARLSLPYWLLARMGAPCLWPVGAAPPRPAKGVWDVPLYPGKHPVNTRIMKIELVPTTNIVLNWATASGTSTREKY